MRIIGGKDYYDSGMAYGQDESVLFVRTGNRCIHDHEMHSRLHLPRIVCSGRLESADHNKHEDRIATLRARRSDAFHDVRIGKLAYGFQVGQAIVCGILYHGLLITETQPFAFPAHVANKRWIWTAEALRAYASDKGLVVVNGQSGTSTTWAPVGAINQQVDIEVLSIDDWFAPRRLDGACREAILTERITIITNDPENPGPGGEGPYRNVHSNWKVDQPTLGDMEFAKALDPYAAFQEISMWRGGVLPADGPPTVEITDDKIKIAKAGFHHPTSFRRAKQESR